MTVLEIVFVGQCEVFVCLDFVHFFLFFLPLGREAHRSANGVSVLKKIVDFSDTYPLKALSCTPSYLNPPQFPSFCM